MCTFQGTTNRIMLVLFLARYLCIPYLQWQLQGVKEIPAFLASHTVFDVLIHDIDAILRCFIQHSPPPGASQSDHLFGSRILASSTIIAIVPCVCCCCITSSPFPFTSYCPSDRGRIPCGCTMWSTLTKRDRQRSFHQGRPLGCVI
jgi:hypothetical protein